jgi:hypothetical protein
LIVSVIVTSVKIARTCAREQQVVRVAALSLALSRRMAKAASTLKLLVTAWMVGLLVAASTLKLLVTAWMVGLLVAASTMKQLVTAWMVGLLVAAWMVGLLVGVTDYTMWCWLGLRASHGAD